MWTLHILHAYIHTPESNRRLPWPSQQGQARHGGPPATTVSPRTSQKKPAPPKGRYSGKKMSQNRPASPFGRSSQNSVPSGRSSPTTRRQPSAKPTRRAHPCPSRGTSIGGYRWKLKKLLRRSTPTEFSLLTDSMTAHLTALQARNQHRHPAMPRGGSAFDSCVLVALFCQSDVAAIGRLEAENAELIEKGRLLRNRAGDLCVSGCEVGGLRGGLPSGAARMLIAQCERATQRLYASERGTLMSGRFFGRSRRLCAAFSWPTRLRHD